MENTQSPQTQKTTANSPFIKALLVLILVVLIIGLVLKNKNEKTTVLPSGADTKSTNGIPPDSLHH